MHIPNNSHSTHQSTRPLQWALLPAALAFALAFAQPVRAVGEPGAPRGLAATADSNAVTLIWRAPESEGTSDISVYKVRWAENSGSDWQPDGDGMDVPGGADARFHRIGGLTDGTAYKAQIAAVNSAGAGAWSGAASATPGGGICGRSFAARRAITFAVLGIEGLAAGKGCADVTTADLAAVRRTLHIHLPSSVRTMQRGDFAGLSAVTRVSANHGGHLTHLPPGLFDGLTAVTDLDFGFNALQHLPPGLFSVLPNLQRLSLNGNSLSALPHGIFDGLPALKSLDLRNNPFKTLPVGIFNELPALTKLQLDHVMFTRPVPPGVFVGLSESILRELGVPSQPRDVSVSGGSERVTVHWSHPLRIGHVQNLFDRTQPPVPPVYRLRWKLQSAAAFAPGDILTVTESPDGRNFAPTRAVITDLTADSAYEVQVAASNGFAYGAYAISRGATRGGGAADGAPGMPLIHRALPGKQTISLAWSPPADDGGADLIAYRVRWADAADASPTYLNPGRPGARADGFVVPEGLPAGRLVRQYLITNLDNGTTYNAQVAAVNSSGIGDWSVVASVEPGSGICERTPQVRDAIVAALQVADCAGVTDAGLAGLARLDMRMREVRHLLPGDFAGLSALTELDLSQNLLVTLPQRVLAIPTLTILNLSRNALRELQPHAFNETPALAELDLNRNHLSRLPANVFNNTPNLVKLNLNDNQLSALPGNVFAPLFTRVSLAMPHSSKLEELYLSGNGLTALPFGLFANGTVRQLRALKALDLSHNNLTILPNEVFASLGKLLTLNLHNNALAGLHEDTFLTLDALTELDLSRNHLTAVPRSVFAKLGLQTGESALRKLFLADNFLSTLPRGVFSGLPHLMELRLGGNVFNDGHFGPVGGPLPPDVFKGVNDRIRHSLGIPTQPRDVAATEGHERLSVSWTKPLFHHFFYRLRWKLSGDEVEYAPADILQFLRDEKTSHRIEELEGGKEYEVQIAAGNGFAFSDYVTVTATTRGGASAQRAMLPPDAPRNVRALSGNGALALAWSAPGFDGGADISGYKVRWANKTAETTYLNEGGAEGMDVDGGASAFRYRITGLVNAATYSAQVAAVNTFNTGDFTGSDFIPDANRLNVDGNDVTNSVDGVLIARYLLGLRGGPLFVGLADSNLDESGILANLRDVYDSGGFDVNGDGKTNAADGIIIARYFLGVSGDARTDGQAAAGRTALEKVAKSIEDLQTSP
ncbi:MAG: fibronectin type III domain-containing protein [Gammaproteobacteria bacterium]